MSHSKPISTQHLKCNCYSVQSYMLNTQFDRKSVALGMIQSLCSHLCDNFLKWVGVVLTLTTLPTLISPACVLLPTMVYHVAYILIGSID